MTLEAELKSLLLPTHPPPIITEVLNKTVETENAISTEDKECQTDKATEETGYKKKKAGRKAKGNIQEV